MSKFNARDMERVLRYLLSLERIDSSLLKIPDHILSSLDGLSSDNFQIYMDYLHSNEYITFGVADYPEQDNFLWIRIEPSGFAYFSMKDADRSKVFKKNIQYWITTAIAVIALLTAIFKP